MDIVFDDAKARLNVAKHGVTFDEAEGCLSDPRALVQEDIHALGENRWVLIGLSRRGRLLVVVFTVRGEFTRLISARRPTKREIGDYAKRI